MTLISADLNIKISLSLNLLFMIKSDKNINKQSKYDKVEAIATPEAFILGISTEHRIVLTIMTTNNTIVITPGLPIAWKYDENR